jgi:P4 family phage/plasmid primase-like protien
LPYTSKPRSDEDNSETVLYPVVNDKSNFSIFNYCATYVNKDDIDLDVLFPDDTKSENSKVFQQLDIPNKEDLDLVIKLMECLKDERADDYDDWMQIGWCLYNIDKNIHLQTWIDFSKRSDKYTDGYCEKLWSKMTKKDKTIGSLKYWAKLDNPEKYSKIIESSITKYVDITVRGGGTDYDMANLISKLKKDELVYDNDMYFLVNKHNIWKSYKKATFKSSLCGEELSCLFTSRAHYWNTQCRRDDITQEEKELYSERATQCCELAKKVKASKCQSAIIEQVPCHIQIDKFIETKLDCNTNLFAFNNKVFDLEKDTVRDIEPTDYISLTTGYDYDEHIDEEIVQKVKGWLRSLFKTDEMYTYLLNVLTTVLLGKNTYSEFYIMTGKGSNGKSILSKFMDYLMGEYSLKVDSTTFTKKTQKANETSVMNNSKGKRFVYTVEPESDDKMQSASLKELSGEDKLSTRGLYKEPIEFYPQFKLFLACNDVPKLSTCEDANEKNAMGRRLRIIKFPFTFTSNPKEEDDRMVDLTWGDNIRDDIRYRQAFAKILVDNWKIVKGLKSLNAPAEVMECSMQYLRDSNDVHKWITEKYIYDTKTKKNIEEEVLTTKDRFRVRMLHQLFKQDTRSLLDERTFAQRLDGMGLLQIKPGNVSTIHFIKERPPQEDDEEEC